MKLCEFYKTDYRISFVNCLRQYWRQSKMWTCIGEPKEKHLLFLLDGCSARYEFPSGRVLHAGTGDVVYMPRGSQYTVTFSDFESENSGTVGVNFDIESGIEPSPDGIEIFTLPSARPLFSEIELYARSLCRVPSRYNVCIYNLISLLGEYGDTCRVMEGFGLIGVGVEYMHSHLAEDITVESLAEMCNVSAVYFRRLFHKCMGTSPASYRLNMRLERACEYLLHTESSVAEIGALLGFGDTSYFIKRFRERYSVSPRVYRERNSNKLEIKTLLG